MQYWEGSSGVSHHTAPINMLYALYQALFLIFEEGLEAVCERHLNVHRRLVEGLEALGLEMMVPEPYRLPMLATVKVPTGVDESRVRDALRKDYFIEIGAGLGPLSGQIWRIGLMGHTAREKNVDRLLFALEKTL